MFGTDSAIVATGRFQRLHLGSLNYLLAAKYLATQTRSSFYILTGPFDNELAVHGSRETEPMNRRLLNFEERKLILSATLDIHPSSILNQRGSPHHGEPGLSAWIADFFEPLLQRGALTTDALCNARIKCLALFVAIKKDDIRYYKSGQQQHYSDLLKASYPAISIIDYFAISRGRSELEQLSASKLAAGRKNEPSALVPTMLFAEMLLRGHTEASLLTYSDVIMAIAKRFGTQPIDEETLRSTAPFLV